ncbi:hypothetical protein D3C81_1833880 [compost metagenome]
MERPHRAYAQIPDMQRARIDQQIEGIHFQFGNVLGDRQQALRGFAQVYPAATTKKQLHVVFTFQRLHLRGQGWLAEAERTRRRGKATVAGDGKEGTKLGGSHL